MFSNARTGSDASHRLLRNVQNVLTIRVIREGGLRRVVRSTSIAQLDILDETE